ncbi:uncharacterized protein BO72DRAFT_47377 [Aspergillus fijiensis CBS 313.89]|uniref:Uncharacterized protein n=1 Tax=Aspergillus fijiensis CBS 313.89 TaxID=1448319 RepID=A0A8G1RU13_9EURO|nr:uncharacterized protein BO72DRAFT_47377 [Aspergillus fijiensis CBS 313.89]RAK79505.1 hypothetical protein BO72DRAFT_47377 [Aspergillus fijiensis CBS 313.89]
MVWTCGSTCPLWSSTTAIGFLSDDEVKERALSGHLMMTVLAGWKAVPDYPSSLRVYCWARLDFQVSWASD